MLAIMFLVLYYQSTICRNIFFCIFFQNKRNEEKNVSLQEKAGRQSTCDASGESIGGDNHFPSGNTSARLLLLQKK